MEGEREGGREGGREGREGGSEGEVSEWQTGMLEGGGGREGRVSLQLFAGSGMRVYCSECLKSSKDTFNFAQLLFTMPLMR